MRILLFLLAATAVFNCNSNSTQKEKADSKFKVYEGTYLYMADANMFESCDKKMRMAVEGKAYLDLERRYLRTVDGGEKVYVRLKGYEDMVMSMEGTKKVKAILVTEVLEVSKEDKCN